MTYPLSEKLLGKPEVIFGSLGKESEVTYFYYAEDLERALERHHKDISVALEALTWADEMLIARDEMNAKVHCAPLRLSPITERIKAARAFLEGRK